MGYVSALPLCALLFFACGILADTNFQSHLLMFPQNPVIEIGTNFTATCLIFNTTEVTADDLYWKLSDVNIPREQYRKINNSAVSVTVPITRDRSMEWLFCLCNKKSNYVILNKGKFMHGLSLRTGYRPEKPQNLSCISFQRKDAFLSPLQCRWETTGRQTPHVPVTFTLKVMQVVSAKTISNSTKASWAQVEFESYPFHTELEIWVEAVNDLGAVESEHLRKEAQHFVKTNPPEVKVLSEKSFPTSLLLNWTTPIPSPYIRLTYQIRFCSPKSPGWSHVPLSDINDKMNSYRLQDLRAYTPYTVQVRCSDVDNPHGYWSEWSRNVTMMTPGDKPSSPPKLWRTVVQNGTRERLVQIICKDPEFSNEKITRFDVKVQKLKDGASNQSEGWKSVFVNRSEAEDAERSITLLEQISLSDLQSVRVSAVAFNSLGPSPMTTLTFLDKPQDNPPVEEMEVWPHEGQLMVEWKPPRGRLPSEYVVEWLSDDSLDWRRASKSSKHMLTGKLEPFVCYTVSIYPIYSKKVGKPVQTLAYVEQGAPKQGPFVKLDGEPRHNEASLVWEEIPPRFRRGFITNYTVYYKLGEETRAVSVPANSTSLKLESLTRNSHYEVWVQASTVAGSTNGSTHSFITMKYAPEIIEAISLGAGLTILVVFLICIYKKDTIMKRLWPRVPDGRQSSIGTWSPDCSLKVEPPKESCVSGISVLVSMCESQNGFEEDKASLSLRKDKYTSEEHSSGIGGSSCMSSPRQSVSDSDEGADIADTTASTVQYSSVVASSAYKGQTPASQPQHSVFSRSESTQPLLDSEEHMDMFVQEASGRFERLPPHDNTCSEVFSAPDEEQLDCCQEADDLQADGQPAPSSYMPQLGGYKPQ
ncbi:interleukin-6 receptor subunit beta isoform X1 [Oryzias melastigma]|uniref:Interleukin 6 signal transducer n=1 Tax=Oryzias melastigma TaxID=30732 RepID=A0A3B3CBK1_ORYME|nr:interleukin-6 receptor subunit beta isoform X1 [Oryzias melastigma]